MANQVTLRTMTIADIPLGMRLKSQAGWNQTLADWKRFLTLSPNGCFVATIDGVDVGTAATFTLGNVGWIAMILVDPAARGQGVGSAMMHHCLSYLQSQNVISIRLDATALGKPVYDKLGFVDQFKLVRFEGTLPTNESFDVAQPRVVTRIAENHHAAIKSLDTIATKTDRSELLNWLLTQPGEEGAGHAFVAYEGEKIVGYCLSRRGANAAFIGPCVAITAQAGDALLQAVAQTFAGQRVLVDIPADHAKATAWAKAYGLRQQRELTRMCKGSAVLENVDQLWTSSGPEKG